MSERKRSGNWTTCRKCHRVLWVEDGPVCPECKAEKAPVAEAETEAPSEPESVDPAPEPEPPLVPAEGEIVYSRRRKRSSED
jgi:uncharacterized Zn finger protein (UPF0148 family)